MEKTVIVSAARTPIGSFQGALSTVPAPKLGAIAIAKTLAQTGLSASEVGEVIMGNVLSAGVGQAPARQAALGAGFPVSVPCMTINKVCGSGLKAVMLGSDSIALGRAQVVVCGGQENMSLAPHLLENSRAGYRMGNFQATDSMLKDGLWDPYKNWHMGNAGELCAKEHKFSRQMQDEFALESYKMAQNAVAKSYFKNEIAEVEVAGKKGSLLVQLDEEPAKAQFDKMPTLKPAFDASGTITAANASKLNDGGAALMLMSESEAKRRGLKPLARICGHSTFAQSPEWFTTAPVGAIKSLLQKTGKTASQIDLWEINEAFAVVSLAAMKEFSLPRQSVNVHGGAIALGHPIGASGARILTTLVHALQTHQLKTGVATLCIGGGEAVALMIERPGN